MEWLQSLFEILPNIGKYALIVLSGIMADRGLKRLQAFRKRTQAGSETVIDVDKMIQTYTVNMKKSSDMLEDEQKKRVSISKKYNELESKYHDQAHENGRLSTYNAGTLQLLNAHNQVCDCDNKDLIEYAELLEESPKMVEFIHRFEQIAKKHGLYRANGGHKKEPGDQGEIDESNFGNMKWLKIWQDWAGDSVFRIGASLIAAIVLILLLGGLIGFLLG